MKKTDRLIASLLSLVLLICVLPVSQLATALSYKTESAYENDFNDTTLAELESDFYFAYDSVDNTNNITNDENTWKLDTITAAEAATYMGAADGKLLRKSGVSMEGTDPERFSFQQLYMFYKNQSFSGSFELDVTMAPSPRTVNMIHFSPQCDNQSSIYKNGFTLAILARPSYDASGAGITLWLGDAADARRELYDWNIRTSDSDAVSAQLSKAEYSAFDFRIVFENGTASVYVDGSENPILKRDNLAKDSYYASISLGKVIWSTTTVDDFYIGAIKEGADDDTDPETDRVEEVGKYINRFGAEDLSSAFGDDFVFGYDNTNYVATGYEKLEKADVSKYLKLNSGVIERVNNSSESGTDSRRPYWQQVYMYYKNQSFKNFEFSVDLTSTHDGFEMIHFAPSTDAPIYASGFTFAAKYNVFETKYDLFLGNAEEATTDLDFWYIKSESTAAHATVTGKEKTLTVKIVFDSGTATAYIDGEKVLEKSGLEITNYYPAVALGYNLADDWRGGIDNFIIKKIESSGGSDFAPVEEAGKYSNNFDADTLSEAFDDDFVFAYDNTNGVKWELESLDENSLANYITLNNGVIERINNSSETDADGKRPYWQQVYMYYKNQSFKNFEFSVDLTSTHDGFEMIHFAPDTDKSIYASGFTFAAKYDAFNKQYDLFLGNAAEATQDLDFFYVKTESTAAHATVTGKEKTVTVKIVFDNGTATAYIDGEKVLEKSGLDTVEYYPAIALGYNLADDWRGAFDNFEIVSSYEYLRNEADGEYSTNFDVGDNTGFILNDFNFYYDTDESGENSLVDITEDPSKYVKLGTKLQRVHPSDERDAFSEGNRPYWCMAYYTYKNQTFKDFYLTVDAYLPGGSAYNAITVGSMGGGLKTNGGFTLGFWNESGTGMQVYLGDASDVGNNFNDWYIHDCSGKATFTHDNNNYNFKIELAVVDGRASVSINGTEVLSSIYVGTVDGYVSLVNGINGGSYYDNLSIVDYDKLEVDPEVQNKIVSIEKVNDVIWERTAENSNTNLLNLPETLKVTTDKGTELSRKISWSSEDYKPGQPGTYTFIGTPVLPVDKTIINPDGITASAKVTVTVDYDTSTTVKFYIDALSDFEKDWVSLYSSNPKAEDYVTTSIDSLYYMDNGALRRKDAAGEIGDHAEIQSLVYTGRTFRNFQLDVDFRQGGNTWGQAMVAFGIEDPNTYVTLNGGGAAAYLTMEGSARFRGQLVRDTNSNGEVVANSNFADYAGTWSTKMHHMTLKVTKLKAILEIDGVEVHECALQEGYTGGYIGFMSNKNMAMYDNLSITALDYDGNVITLEEHDNLPDTFDPNDPLIGEEEDDGTAAEIIGIDYKNNLNNKYSGLLGNGESSSIGDDYANDVNGSTPATGDSFPLYNVVAITGLAALAVLVSLRLKKRVRNI